MTHRTGLGGLFGGKTAPSAYQTALDAGRLARAGGETETALAAFDRARELAEGEVQRAIVDIQRAETLVEADRLDEADAALARARDIATGAQRLYAQIAGGLVAQARGQRDTAHQTYEEAQDAARAAVLVGPEARAACHLADLYLAEGNSSYAVHLFREFLPRLTSATDIDWSPYFIGRLGQALIDGGDVVEGHQVIARGLELAEQAGNKRCQRLWSLALGKLAAADRRYGDARPRLEAALHLSDGRPPAELARERRLLAETCLALGDDATAADHATEGLAAAEASGDRMLVAQARGMLGVVLRAQGRPDEALPHLQAAVAVNGAPEVRRALAAALTADRQTDAARALFEESVRHAPEGSLALAEARRDLGLYHFQRREYAEAIAAWTPTVSIFEIHHVYAAAARVCIDLSGARRGLGQQVRAFKDIDQALTLLSYVPATDDETRGVVLANAAAAYAEQGDVETADSFFNDSVVIAQRLGDEVAESTRSGNYGWFLIQAGRPRRAMANIELALRISQRRNLQPQQAIQLDNLGLACDAVADYEVALRHHRSALAQIAEQVEPSWKASIQINLAATLVQLGQFDEADVLLGEALIYARANPYSDLLVRALIAQSALRDKQGRPQDAPADEAVTLARRHELRRLLADALTAQSQRDAALGDLPAARAAWDEAVRLYTALKMPQARFTPGWLTEIKAT